MKKYRRLSVALVATCLTVGMVAAPSALAGEGGSKAKAVTSQKAKAAGSSGLPRTTSQRLRRRIVRTEESLRGTRKAIETLLALSRGNRDGLAFLSAAAPQLINGLVALRDGTLQLKTILETQVQPALIRLRDEVGPGLKRLGDNYTADEYGIVQFALPDNSIGADDGDSAPDVIPGCFYESGNIPDNVQSAMVSGQCLIPANADPGAQILFLSGIHSNEDDGTGPANAAGVAGVVAYEQRATSGALAGAGATTPDATIGPTVLIPTKSTMTPTQPRLRYPKEPNVD